MTAMIIGLVLFLGPHSIRIFADQWRSRTIERVGLNTWKGIFSLVSLLGFALIVWGYGEARVDTPWLWQPPIWTRHLAALLTVPAFVLITATYVPGTHLNARLGHPMLLGVKVWAFAHLLSNGSLADVILFGSFLVWAIVNYAKSRRRDRAEGITRNAKSWGRDGLALVVGLVLWAVFAFYLHGLLIGVRPFGG